MDLHLISVSDSSLNIDTLGVQARVADTVDQILDLFLESVQKAHPNLKCVWILRTMCG